MNTRKILYASYFVAALFAALIFSPARAAEQFSLAASQEQSSLTDSVTDPATVLAPVSAPISPPSAEQLPAKAQSPLTVAIPVTITPIAPAASPDQNGAHAPAAPTVTNISGPVAKPSKDDHAVWWGLLITALVFAVIFFNVRNMQNGDNRYGPGAQWDPADYNRPRGRRMSDRQRRELREEYQSHRGYEDDELIEPTISSDDAWSSQRRNGRRLESEPAQTMKPRYQRQSSATLILPTDTDKKTFADVAGQEETVARLREICLWLKQPEIYNRHDAELPRGILFVGAPGTGKTLCAQALAGETHGSMFIIAASSFVEIYVGVGASRVRGLFADAKAQRKQTGKPVIIFIDELDAVGGARSQSPNSNSEREQTLNQLLVEMDGFTKNEGIIVVAATNRADMLDPALRRKGRFDLEVHVDLPDMNGREAILKVHTRNKTLDQTVDFKLLARRTFGMSGADLKAAANEAAVIAAREQGRREQELTVQNNGSLPTLPASDQIVPITLAMFDEAISIVESGDARRERFKAMSLRDKKQVAYHELGHAVVTHRSGGDPITKITILPRGQALGYVQTHSEGDRWNLTEDEMLKRITSAMAGRIAQEIFLQTVDTGASSDFEQANKMARAMVTQFGMSPLGHIFVPQNAAIGPALSDKIDEASNAIVIRCGLEAHRILEENSEKVEALVDLLIDKETLFGSDFVAVFEEAAKSRQNKSSSPAEKPEV